MTKPKKIKSTLNEYHKKRSKVALKEVAKMLKHPSSYEEVKSQIQQRLNG